MRCSICKFRACDKAGCQTGLHGRAPVAPYQIKGCQGVLKFHVSFGHGAGPSYKAGTGRVAARSLVRRCSPCRMAILRGVSFQILVRRDGRVPDRATGQGSSPKDDLQVTKISRVTRQGASILLLRGGGSATKKAVHHLLVRGGLYNSRRCGAGCVCVCIYIYIYGCPPHRPTEPKVFELHSLRILRETWVFELHGLLFLRGT
jgi:hypothetical protein